MSSERTGGWLTVAEVAVELGVVTRTVYAFINRGELSACRMGRVIRVRQSEIEAFVARNAIHPGDLNHLFHREPRRSDAD